MNGIKCLATDISSKALKSAVNNFKKYNLNIDTMVTDGLNNISIKYDDTIIISGMGTDTIMKILYDGLNNDLVISSNNHLERLRRYVVSIGYYIDKEIFVIDNNKPYLIIKFKKGYECYNDYDYVIGPKIKDNTYFDYLKNKYLKILDNIPFKYQDKIKYYKRLICEIDKRRK